MLHKYAKKANLSIVHLRLHTSSVRSNHIAFLSCCYCLPLEISPTIHLKSNHKSSSEKLKMYQKWELKFQKVNFFWEKRTITFQKPLPHRVTQPCLSTDHFIRAIKCIDSILTGECYVFLMDNSWQQAQAWLETAISTVFFKPMLFLLSFYNWGKGNY